MSKVMKSRGLATKKESDPRDSKVYRITIGMIYKSDNNFDDVSNFSYETLIAKDAIQAASKIKLGKNQYVAEVKLVDILTQ